MQRQRSIIGSLPETLDFDHGSTSGNAIIDQQICLSTMRDPAENRLTEFMLSPGHMNDPYANSIDQERQNLSGWSLVEPSSSGQQNQASHDDRKVEHGWSSSASSSVGAGPRLEERRYEPTNILSLNRVNVNPQFERISNSDAIPQNINLNAGFVGHGGDNCQVMDGSAIYKPRGAESERNSPARGSDNFLCPSGNGGYIVEQNDGRPGCSLDGRRQSCKRKAVEGNIGQSSVAGSSSFYQRSESNLWPGVPTRYDAGSSLSISAPSEQVNPRLGLGVRGLACDAIPEPAVAERADSSHRNFRLRINSSNQESSPPSLFSAGSTVRRSSISSSHRSSRPLPMDHSLDFRSSSAMDSITQNQPVISAPALPQNVQSFRWSESSSSRSGTSSSSISMDDREEPNARNIARHIWEHPIFAPATELRTSVRNPANRTLTSGQVSGPANVGSTSRSGANTGIHPLSAPTWGPHTNPPSRNSRRLADYARRSLFSSAAAAAADTGGQSSTHSPFHSGASSSEDTMPSSGAGNQGLHRPHPRSASWLERQGDGVLGIPYPLRALASEGRSRLVVSEVCFLSSVRVSSISLNFKGGLTVDVIVICSHHC